MCCRFEGRGDCRGHCIIAEVQRRSGIRVMTVKNLDRLINNNFVLFNQSNYDSFELSIKVVMQTTEMYHIQYVTVRSSY